MTDELVQKLARTFITRAEVTRSDFGGAKLDALALDFFDGAFAALEAVGHEKATAVRDAATFVVFSEGYAGVQRLARHEA